MLSLLPSQPVGLMIADRSTPSQPKRWIDWKVGDGINSRRGERSLAHSHGKRSFWCPVNNAMLLWLVTDLSTGKSLPRFSRDSSPALLTKIYPFPRRANHI